MHIPDGYLGPQTYGAMYVVMTPFWMVAAKKVRDTLKAKQVPFLALGAVFSFVIMMFNVPAPGGTTGHAVGGALLGIVLGPWAAMLAISAALVVQALLFGDGGITAIGANCFNMAVIIPFVGYAVYRLLAGKAEASSGRRVAAAGIAGYLSINVAAFCAAVMFGIQPAIAHRLDGTPLYCPYPLKVTIPAMLSEHLLIFGFIEAVVTALAIAYLYKMDPALIAAERVEKARETVNRRPAIIYACIGIAALVILAPLGLIATGTAWGEWSAEDIKQRLGFVPQGFAKLEGIWKALMPDYSMSGWGGTSGAVGGYILSAVVGIAVTALVIFAIFKLITYRRAKSDVE
jgi:cobalt/nickel transport system permease protein